jgi:hypothetical protein
MLIVGAASIASPLPAASAPSAAPYRAARTGSHEAPMLTAFGNEVTLGLPSPIPFGPSTNESGGMPRRGTPALPLPTRESFSDGVIRASSASAR